MGKRGRKGLDYASQLYAENFATRQNIKRDRKTIYCDFYIRILTEIACSRFEWQGMPEEIDLRFLELTLFRSALCGFFFDNDYDRYFALRASSAGRWNMYDNPVALTMTGNGMITRNNMPTFPTTRKVHGIPVTNDDGSKVIDPGCVPIWGNTLRCPDWDIVYLSATKLAEVEITVENTLQTLRQPYLIAAEDSERLTVANVFRQMQEGQLAVFGSPDLMRTIEEKIKVFPLGVNQDYRTPGELIRDKQLLWSEAMMFLGVNNTTVEKNAHVLEDEINANNAQIQAVRTSALNARKLAAKEINRRFGLAVSVDWSTQIDYGDVEEVSQPPEGGDSE